MRPPSNLRTPIHDPSHPKPRALALVPGSQRVMGSRSGTTFRCQHTTGGTKGITPVIADLTNAVHDGGPPITTVVLGTYAWGR